MSVTTTQYIRKPLYVAAVRITKANFEELADWCQGEIQDEWVLGEETSGNKKFIRVRVHNPKNPRQTKGFVGDWILYTERGYKVYTNKAFRESFDEVSGKDAIGFPDASNGGVVMGSEQILPGVTLNQALDWLRKQPELTLEQICELVKSGETCSVEKTT